jgi:hypothetical protein
VLVVCLFFLSDVSSVHCSLPLRLTFISKTWPGTVCCYWTNTPQFCFLLVCLFLEGSIHAATVSCFVSIVLFVIVLCFPSNVSSVSGFFIVDFPHRFSLTFIYTTWPGTGRCCWTMEYKCIQYIIYRLNLNYSERCEIWTFQGHTLPIVPI